MTEEGEVDGNGKISASSQQAGAEKNEDKDFTSYASNEHSGVPKRKIGLGRGRLRGFG